MIININDFQKGKISIVHMHNNLDALFDMIDESEKSKDLIVKFHEYWDYIEEIIATENIKKFENEIEKKIVPNFKEYLMSVFIMDQSNLITNIQE